jgi:hypothetical protein
MTMLMAGQGARRRLPTSPQPEVPHEQGRAQRDVIRTTVFHTSLLLTSETHVPHSLEAVKREDAGHAGRIRQDFHRGSESRVGSARA